MINTIENRTIELFWDDFIILKTTDRITYLSKLIDGPHKLRRDSDPNCEIFSSREINETEYQA